MNETISQSYKETISQSYKEMQIQLHQDPNYGVMSIEMAPMVLSLAQNNGGKKHLRLWCWQV